MNPDYPLGSKTEYEILRMRRGGTGAQNFRVFAKIQADPSTLRQEFTKWARGATLVGGSETFLLRNVVTGSITPYRASIPQPAIEVERVEL